MSIQIKQETTVVLSEYAEVSIAFTVKSRCVPEPIEDATKGWKLIEVPVDPPWIKDYDVGEPPTRWLNQGWDTSNWRVISAFSGGHRVGGAVVAWKTTGLDFLEDRDDVAALWDIRVAPEWRGKGIGSKLFEHVVRHVSANGCKELKIETQDVNAPACRFYEKQGCRLTQVTPDAYPGWPGETELIWRLKLVRVSMGLSG